MKADSDENQGEKGDGDNLCTVCIRMWKENGTVWVQKSTQDAIVREAWDTGYKLYPIAYMPWDKARSSYHGQASITGLIPNQIAVNKLATNSGVSPSTVYSMLNEKSQNPGVVSLKKLCDGLEISVRTFFDSPLFDDLEQEIQ